MIYFDNAATTGLCDNALRVLFDVSKNIYGNPSTHYSVGVKAKKVLNSSRENIAKILNCNKGQILFTSGGTESNNIVINFLKNKLRKDDEIIVSAIEHSSIIEPIKHINSKIIFVKPNENGVITLDSIKKVFSSKTKAIFVQMINNELGSIMPINEIGSFAFDHNIYFHVDAVQAVGHISIDLRKTYISSLSSSAHKFNGPKGTGFLFINKKIDNLMFGGSQEFGIRPGTENVPNIAAMSEALSFSVSNLDEKQKHITKMVNFLSTELTKNNKITLNTKINGFHSIINFRIKNCSNEAIINLLDLEGICVSAGSACDGKNFEKSHVLKAIGLSDDDVNSSIRVSLSSSNTLEECKIFINKINKIIEKLSHGII